MPVLSYSQIATYLHCSHKWHLAFEKKLAPRIDRPCLQIGSLVHKGLEVCWKAYRDGLETPEDFIEAGYKDLIDKALDKIHAAYLERFAFVDEETGEIGTNLFAHELEQAAERVEKSKYIAFEAFKTLYEKYEPVPVVGDKETERAVEHNFRLKLWKGWYYSGTVDLIAREKANPARVWLIDYKIRKAFQTEDDEQFNLQMASYQYALKKNGICTLGSITIQIYNDLPSVPSLNKDGTMSRQYIKCTWEDYEKALLEAGLDPDATVTPKGKECVSYREEMVPKLEAAKFYAYTMSFRSSKEVDNTWQNVIMLGARQIKRKTKLIIRNLTGFNCKGCGYRPLCLAPLRGHDVEVIERNQFIHNDYADKYLDEEMEMLQNA